MNIYLINALLVLLVIRQIREHQLGLRALAVPSSPSAPPP
jgi:hypothetical protein